jgi:hypothetical protein
MKVSNSLGLYNARDWLICEHVALDKCNVSWRATSEKLLPASTKYVAYINKQNGGTHASL